MKVKALAGSLAGLGSLIGGGACAETVSDVMQPPAVVARVRGDFTLDGKLDKAEWKRAPIHSLSLLDSSANLPELSRTKIVADPYEGGVFSSFSEKSSCTLALPSKTTTSLRRSLRIRLISTAAAMWLKSSSKPTTHRATSSCTFHRLVTRRASFSLAPAMRDFPSVSRSR